MKVLITGGLGQIGSHVAELLLNKNNKVFIIDNLKTGRSINLRPHKNLKISKHGIDNKTVLEEIFNEFHPEIVVHAAASYKDPNDWYSDTISNCVGGSNVINLSKKFDVKRFIYFQTALCYGLKPEQNPIPIDYKRDPQGSSYAISKTTNELYLELSGLDYVTFRLANVIGPRNMAGPLPIFYERLTNGKQCFVTKSRRDFVYVKDLANCVIKACDGIGHGPYHFSSGKDVSILELYDEVVNALKIDKYPKPLIKEIQNDDVDSILLDPSKTFQDFGKIEFTPLNIIVRESILYYKKFGTIGEITHLKLAEKEKK